jgi:hypothetical protein
LSQFPFFQCDVIFAVVGFTQVTSTGIFTLVQVELVAKGPSGGEFTYPFFVEHQLDLVGVDLHLAGDYRDGVVC